MILPPVILKIFNLKPEESMKFTLLFLHSFCLGILISFHFVPANSMFILNFGSEKLPLAYLVAGAVGYVSTMIYSKLQKFISSANLFLIALLFLLLIIVSQRLGFVFFGGEKWQSFYVFIWTPFIYTLVAMETGGLALSLLDLRQMKRLLGFINIGGISASALGYITIPVLLRYIEVIDLLTIAAVGIVISIVLLLIIVRKFPEALTRQIEKKTVRAQAKFKDLFKEKYFLLIFGSAMLATIVIYFNDFSYLASIREQTGKLFNSKAQVSNFIALISFTFKSGELIFSYFANRILSRHGLGLGLTLLPFVSTVLIFFATISGFIVGPLSLAFFSFIVLNKILDRTLRKSVDEISFNILYQPLPSRQKLEIQTKVGIIIQMTSGIAGLILFVIGELLTSETGLNLKFFNMFFLPVLFAWSFVATKLYLEYKRRLRQILLDKSRDKKRDIYKYIYGSELLTKKFKKFNDEVVNMSVMILSETNPSALEPHASSLLTRSDIARKAILRNVDPTWRQRLLATIKKVLRTETAEDNRELALQAISNLDFSEVENFSEEMVKNIINSENYNDKLTLVKYLVNNSLPNDEKIIERLLDEKDPIIKKSAIRLAGKRDFSKLKNKLLSLLKSKEYYHLVISTLLEIGERILPDLEQMFEKETDSAVLNRIIEIYAKIGSKQAKSLLIKYLNYPNKEVQLSVIHALYFCKFQASDEDVNLIMPKLEEVVENITWIIAVIIDIESKKNTLKLYQSLDLEREANFEILFKILSFIYDPKIINLIRKNIIGENTIFALEIIDNFISQEIKQLIIPLFDNISNHQRLKKLQSFFPQQVLNLSDRLKDIIIRDYNKVDVWTVAVAIELLGKIHKQKKSKEQKAIKHGDFIQVDVWTKENALNALEKIRRSEMPDEIFVCLYHPDELIYGISSKIAWDENPTRCIDYLNKLPTRKQELIRILEDEANLKHLLSERLRLLKRHPLFFNVPHNNLLSVAKLCKLRELKRSEKIYLHTQDNSEDIFILIKGVLSYKKEKPNEIIFQKNEIIAKGLNIEQKAEFLIAETATIVMEANRFDYFNLMVDETELIQHMFEEIQTKKEEEDSEGNESV